jgi:putative Mg2+ transporter-C (MgtC) family protein
MAPFTFEWQSLFDIVVAYAMALPVGWEREMHERSAGLRTFPLVSVASCAFVAVAARALHGPDAQSRVIQGLIAGVGFIGAGTIMKSGRAIHGTATAASILTTGVIGICVAYHFYDVAILLSVMSLVTLRLFQAWKHLEPGIHDWDPDTSTSTTRKPRSGSGQV